LKKTGFGKVLKKSKEKKKLRLKKGAELGLGCARIAAVDGSL